MEKSKYRWSPKRSIKAYEIAQLLPVVARMFAEPQSEYSDLNRIIESLPAHLGKHFTLKEG